MTAQLKLWEEVRILQLYIMMGNHASGPLNSSTVNEHTSDNSTHTPSIYDIRAWCMTASQCCLNSADIVQLDNFTGQSDQLTPSVAYLHVRFYCG